MNKKKRNARHLHTPFHFSYLTFFPIILLIAGMLFLLSLRKATNDQRRIGQSLRMNASPQVSGTQPRDRIITYRIQYGDSMEEIAEKFAISEESIIWANDLPESGIQPDMIIHIPPVTGVIHTVGSFETVESIAKMYGADPYDIYSFPYNEFSDDPEFPLTPGQTLIVPGGRRDPIILPGVLGAFWRRLWR